MNTGRTISQPLKDMGTLKALQSLDLLVTEPCEKIAMVSEAFPCHSKRSLTSSRSETELKMPPKPTLLRNSRSLEDVPHFSLY